MSDEPAPPQPTPATPPPVAAPAPAVTDNILEDPQKLGHILYGLFASGFITGGLGTIAGFVLALMTQDKQKGSWMESHITWLIRTFIISLIGGLICFVLMFVLIGIPLAFALAVWGIYRIVKGWIAVTEQKALPAPEAFI